MSSRRAAWPSCPMSVTSPSGPIMARVDVTSFSRSGSMGGLVTCVSKSTQPMNAHLLLSSYSAGQPCLDGTGLLGAKTQETVKQACKIIISLCKPWYGSFPGRKIENPTCNCDTGYTQCCNTYAHTKQEISNTQERGDRKNHHEA